MMDSPYAYREEIRAYTVIQLFVEKVRIHNAILHIRSLPPDAPEWQRNPSPEVILEINQHYIAAVEDELKQRGIVFESSDCYVPFELPKQNTEKVKMLKKKLRRALKSLSAEEGYIVFGRYHVKGAPKNYDLENMLFYNIGPSAFTNCAKYGVGFGELKANETDPYQYCYQIMSVKEAEQYFSALPVAAAWEKIELEQGENKPGRYFDSLNKRKDLIYFQGTQIPCSFALRIHLNLQRKCNSASYMKAVLDGTICAFHTQNGHYLLGERVVRQKNGAWNPADDRLKLCLITVSYCNEKSSFSGKIYAMD